MARRFRARWSLVHQQGADLGVALLLADVARLDHGPDHLGALAMDGAGGEGDGIEAAVLVDEDLFPLDAGPLGEGAVDGAFGQGEVGSVRTGVVDDVVQRSPGGLLEGVAGQFFRRPVHEDAVLPVVHQEDRHGRIVQDDVQPLGCVAQPLLHLPVLGRVLDGGVEDRVVAVVEQLELDGDVVFGPVLAPMDGVEVEPIDFAGEERPDQSQEVVATDAGLQIPGRQAGQFVRAVAQIIPGALVDQPKIEVLDAEDIDLARGFLNDPPQALAGHRDGFGHAPRLSPMVRRT